MKKILNSMNAIFAFAFTLICSLLGGGVVMAAGTAINDAGTTEGGFGKDMEYDSNNTPHTTYSNQKGEGIATLTRDIDEDTDGDFLDKDIDRKITKIRPMSTPIDQISRYADAGSTKEFNFKYFSIGTRPIKTTVLTPAEGSYSILTSDQSSGTSVVLPVANPEIFTEDDTIRVVGVKAKTDYKGYAYQSTDTNVPDLILKVCGFDASNTGYPVVHAVNGILASDQQAIWSPKIVAGTTLIRLGKACGELDVQTGRFANVPTPTEQYCQNFMMQVEQSTFEKLSAKNVDWTFSDLEEDGIYDMRLGMEGSFLFGDMNKIKHVSKHNQYTWFTKGIWWQAGQEWTVGTAGETALSDDDLVDLAKDLFVGTGSGTKQKVMFCGSNMLAALSKIDTDKFKLKENVESWNLKFKSWDTDFGEILTIHHELFDLNGMSDCALAIDPTYIGKKKFISWTRNVLDLKTAGVRNTDAIVLQEASALYLRYPKAHARLQLASTIAAAQG